MTSRPASRMALAFAMVLAAAPLAAQPSTADRKVEPSAADKKAARELAVQGVTLAEQGDCTAALDKLQKAEELYHAPTILERIGECQVTLGKLVVGTETLLRVVNEDLGPRPNAQFKAAQTRAKELYDRHSPRVAHLRIQVEGLPASVRPALKVDGEPVSAAVVGIDRPMDPGSHTVEASAFGYRTASTSLQLAEGASDTIALRLEPTGTAPASGAPSAPLPPPTTPSGSTSVAASSSTPPAPAEQPKSARRVPTSSIVAYSVAGVGLGVGIVLGIVALGTKSSLDDRCRPKDACPEGSRGDIDALGTQATVSSIGFGIAAAGAVVGTVLLLTGGRDPNHTEPHGRWIRPLVGAGSLGLEGRF